MKSKFSGRKRKSEQQEPESETDVRNDSPDEKGTETEDDIPDDEFEEEEDDDDVRGDGLANTMAQLLQQSTGSKVWFFILMIVLEFEHAQVASTGRKKNEAYERHGDTKERIIGRRKKERRKKAEDQ